MAAALLDRLGRPLRDLRLSVTDRCNFRCGYCMPREEFGADYPFLARRELLSYEELTRLARLFVERGVKKLRVTGGEPLLRQDLPVLVKQLRALPGVELALTTNGVLLPRLAAPLSDAGLDRVTVSLDALDDATFSAMTDSRYTVADVLAGIDAAARAGLGPVKVNAVVRRSLNDHAIEQLARHFHGSGHTLRFIEYMDVGTKNGWVQDEVVTGREIVARVNAVLPLEPVEAAYRGEVAQRYRYLDGGGELGVITSVSQAFCGDCSRARLSSEGTLYTCLFAGSGTSFKQPLRAGASDAELGALIDRQWSRRADRYSELRGQGGDPDGKRRLPLASRVEMSHIGG